MARRKKDEVLQTGEVTVEWKGKPISGTYDVLRGGVVRVHLGMHSRTTQIGGATAEFVARMLLREMLDEGLSETL
jgi:hypothetical protein